MSLLEMLLASLCGFEFLITHVDGEFTIRLRKVRPAVRILFVDDHNKEISTMFTINADASRVFRIKIVDAKGRAAKVDGVPAWNVSPEDGSCSLFPAADGMSCEVKNLAPNDGVGLTVNADADLGAGVRNITGTATIQLLGAEAAAIELSADEEVAG